MARLKTDSPLSRRIVRAFLDFLNSVEPAPGVDLEGLEVAKECLAEVFGIDPSSTDGWEKSDLLVDLFDSREASEKQEHKSVLCHETLSADVPSTSSVEIASAALEASQTLGEDRAREAHNLGVSDDELFGIFFSALEKIHYFKPASDGRDDEVQLDRATRLFHNAAMELQKSGCQTFDGKCLAETFKSQGNKAMQSKLYSDAIELYTFAIALCEDNAVYYCNRAAAYTQINQYAEAILDCLKSIEINPSYSKAYSRLGFAYYAQGNYRDAINKGFMKALQLDPNNDSVKENIRVAEQKLIEEQRRAEHHEGSRSASHQDSNQQSAGGSRSHSVPPPLTSMPFNANGLPADIASMFMNMASNMHQGQHSQASTEADSSTDTFDEPEIRIGGNINLNFGDQMPEDITGALRSVMEMFSGASPSANQPEDMNGRSAPS
ncbi:Small glutamine-rich tetratricopeptide repeat-containing protein [Actinidia chinensis var. chinensis]|uniref:Small glutamine-rich tetratricopeptide repeat-containing protein n=1 Tax=Actinidia chinensis var. chinensis TaxID=1590841 RepID=A0A2R6R3T4_ACTCC|nr:Small glutamine-rich tetratricopeptide repeat-containing protein [Actinidia chinensis var. chinensis]